jgi:hypothetical protein
MINYGEPSQPKPEMELLMSFILSDLVILGWSFAVKTLTAWDLKFQVCLGYTFTPATLD